MARKGKGGLGKAGFFENPPAAQPEESTEAQKRKSIEEAGTDPKPIVKRTTILLDDDALDLIDLLKSKYRREGEPKTQSELCALGLALLAKEKGIKA